MCHQIHLEFSYLSFSLKKWDFTNAPQESYRKFGTLSEYHHPLIPISQLFRRYYAKCAKNPGNPLILHYIYPIFFPFPFIFNRYAYEFFFLLKSSLKQKKEHRNRSSRLGVIDQESTPDEILPMFFPTFWSPDFERLQISKNCFLRDTRQYFLHIRSNFRSDPSTRGGCRRSQPKWKKKNIRQTHIYTFLLQSGKKSALKT